MATNTPPVPDSHPARARKRPSIWGLFAVLLLLGSLGANFVLLVVVLAMSQGPAFTGSVFQERFVGGDSSASDKIAVVQVSGIISYRVPGASSREGVVGDLKEQLKLATEDKSVKAIVIAVDSPGGEVTAADDLYRAVARARKTKPVVVSMGSVAASGGYYIAVGGTHLMAAESTITGSIGVIIQTWNYRKLLDKIGVQIITIKSGEFKDLLSGSRDPAEDARKWEQEKKLVQDLIMESYEQFVGIVAQERQMDLLELKTGLADGRIFSGRQALKTGFVDSLGYYDDAVKKAKELAKITTAKQIRYVAPASFRRVLEMLGESETKSVQVKLEAGPELPRIEAGKLYYLAEQLIR